MVKKKVGGGKRYKAVADAKAKGLSEPKWDGPAPPLHIQKKLTRKVKFLTKVSDGVNLSANKAGVNKKSARKKALPDLTSLGAVLEEVSQRDRDKASGGKTPQKQPGAAVKSAKQRQHILQQESKRLQQVLQHNLYKQDPIAAITNHLTNTLPPAPAAKASAKPSKGPRK